LNPEESDVFFYLRTRPRPCSPDLCHKHTNYFIFFRNILPTIEGIKVLMIN
jgi:hypothetical protein